MAPRPPASTLGPRVAGVVTAPTVRLLDVSYPAFSPPRLAAELAAGNRAPHWARLGPFDLDDAHVRRLTNELVARCDSGAPSPHAVVETIAAEQSRVVVSALAEAARPGTATLVVRLHDAGRELLRPESGPAGNATCLEGWCDAVAPATYDRMMRLTGAGTALVARIVEAARALPRGELDRIAEFAETTDELLVQLVARLLHGCPPECREALGLVALVGYAHERYPSMHPALPTPCVPPWSTDLEDGWTQVDHSWRLPIWKVATRRTRPRITLLTRLVAELTADGAVDEAIELCLDAGAHGLAADLLGEAGLRRLAHERPAAFGRWIARLPFEERQRLGVTADPLSAPSAPAAAATPWSGSGSESESESESGPGDARPRWWRRGRDRAVEPRPRALYPCASTPTPARLVMWEAPPAAVAVPEHFLPCPLTPFVRATPLPAVTAEAVPPPRERPEATRITNVEAQAPESESESESESAPMIAPDVTRPTVRLRLLGDFEVTIDGARVETWRGRQGRALLGFLALNSSRTVGRDTLAESFWPEAPAQASRNRLNVALHGLRLDLRAVSPDAVIVHRNGYTFSPAVDLVIDIVDFEREIASARAAAASGDDHEARACFRRALDWYRDDLLPELAYEEWTILRREQLRVAMLDALSFVAETAFDEGCYAECIEAGHRLVAVDLCREDVHRLLMRSYARLDQPHRAIRQYRACLRQLGTELGVDPRPETVRLFEQIRARRPV